MESFSTLRSLSTFAIQWAPETCTTPFLRQNFQVVLEHSVCDWFSVILGNLRCIFSMVFTDAKCPHDGVGGKCPHVANLPMLVHVGVGNITCINSLASTLHTHTHCSPPNACPLVSIFICTLARPQCLYSPILYFVILYAHTSLFNRFRACIVCELFTLLILLAVAMWVSTILSLGVGTNSCLKNRYYIRSYHYIIIFYIWFFGRCQKFLDITDLLDFLKQSEVSCNSVCVIAVTVFVL